MNVYLVIHRESDIPAGYVRAVYSTQEEAQKHASGLREIYKKRGIDCVLEVHKETIQTEFTSIYKWEQ